MSDSEDTVYNSIIHEALKYDPQRFEDDAEMYMRMGFKGCELALFADMRFDPPKVDILPRVMVSGGKELGRLDIRDII